MINVTKTFLPPLQEYQDILSRAWERSYLTNRGILVQELESRLKDYLGVSNIIAMTNGTLPLQIAIKTLKLKGDIITTPFSYVATTSSIVWEGCNPVFVDIHPDYLTIDETKIEEAITDSTTGILATHVYGNPCNVEAISRIAHKFDLKVIYDAAHCFGIKYNNDSIFNYGDVSTCSFHATKLFHTGEGGALFCNNELYKAAFDHHNFGHDGPGIFSRVGINGKMSELQAALGLSVLPYVNEIIFERKKRVANYDENLRRGKALVIRSGTEWNYGYYPLIFENKEVLLKVMELFSRNNINARRYFYPSLSDLPYVQDYKTPIADSISGRILCLPLYHDLAKKDQERIIELINELN